MKVNERQHVAFAITSDGHARYCEVEEWSIGGLKDHMDGRSPCIPQVLS